MDTILEIYQFGVIEPLFGKTSRQRGGDHEKKLT